VGAEQIPGTLVAWLATGAIHSAVLIAAAWALCAGLARVARDRASLAAARERLWKLALFGGIAAATLSSAGAGAWHVRVGIPAPDLATGALETASIGTLPGAMVPSPSGATDPLEGHGIGIPRFWLEVVAGLWLAGVAIGSAAWMRDRRKLSRRLRGRERIDSGPAFELLEDLRRRSGVRIDVVLSRAPALATPITLGILRPEICIPPRAETGLLRDELEALLAHELAHAQRRDPLLLSLCRAVEVLLFFQPLVRFARSRLLDEAEILCDERAARWTGDPASLASCLAEVATWVVAGSRGAPALSMAARGSRLALRVRGLLDEHREGRAALRGWMLVPATLVLAAAPLAVPGVSMDAHPAPRAADARAPAPASEDLESGARELRGALAALESDFAALTHSPGLPSASTEIRERLSRIEARLRSLREMRAQLDTLVAEISSQER
jgi:beta-lactamase regulating signal transducer with metallopeptidase domain